MKRQSCSGFSVVMLAIITMAMVALFHPALASGACSSPANAIEAENCKAGNPAGEWDISGAGDPSIQGFATDISVNRGETVRFKVKTDASDYRLDIYRIGYYGGNGARLVASVRPSAQLPQDQPACINDTETKLTDCGTWGESASWPVPADAVSGVYIAKLVRTDTGGASHVIFVVRDDSGRSDLLFKTSDTTWQAYNSYGLGYIEYPDYGYPSQKATKVSYNRPFTTRAVNSGLGAYNWFFQSEYPMIRWLEANGYNVSYFTSVDADRRGAEILEHKALLSLGHDEYWSAQMRTNIESARDAGINLAFFSGNTLYRKIRWENSLDGAGTPYRTMVCYNESNAPAPIDPAGPSVWTGTWRNPTFSPPGDGGRPENSLSGTLFTVSTGPNQLGIPLEVPQANGRMRFWRNTAAASLAAGQKSTLGDRVVGYEFDEDIDNGFRPAGLMQLSSTTTPVSAKLLGDNINIGKDVYLPGTATHAMTLYRAPSSALVFSAGTVHWAWGLDAEHDNGPSVVDPSLKQATVNLLADMGVQPASLQSGLVPAASSADTAAPVSTIVSPANGSSLQLGTPLTISGTAVDSGGGVVAAVEVSTDNGLTWHPASGRESWSYSWTPSTQGAVVIRSRSVDDSGNLETAATAVNITIFTASSNPTIWPGTAVPALSDGGADSSVELGVKFRSDISGYITGIRFYKDRSNTGTHTGSLWSSSGTRLATATFSSESASGWQQVNFSAPVAISAGTVYVASYHVSGGHYSVDVNYFTGKGMDSPPLHALASGVSGANGVYAYGSSSVFPNQSWNNSNYWVDVVFSATQTAALSSITLTPAGSTLAPNGTQQFTATGTYSDGSTQNLTTQVTWSSSATGVATVNSSGLATGVAAGSSTISATLGSISGSTALTVQHSSLTITTATLGNAVMNSVYTATIAAGGGTQPYSWSVSAGTLPAGLTLGSTSGVISGTPTAAGSFSFTVQVKDSATPQQTASMVLSLTVVAAQANYTIWPGSTVPGLVDGGADSPVELGVKFRSDISGYITGIRFYKDSSNTGTHSGSLWSSSGTRLATATFSSESASGWQQVNFSTPVAISANTVYVASYHVNGGHYSADANYFTNNGMDSPPLHALAGGESGGNGVFAYGTSSVFPSQSWNNGNYWVDVVFSVTPTATLSSLTLTPSSATVAINGTQQFIATGTYSDGSTQNLTAQVTWSSSNTGVAVVSNSGLATGVIAGSSTISATLGSINCSTVLTVQASTLAITTATLTNAVVNAAYTATISAGGGTQPYSWSVSAGTLPAGLTLGSTSGVISGTPTAAGSFSFTIQAKDSGTPQQTASMVLTLSVTGQSTYTIWPGTTVPALLDGGADNPVELGVKFRSDISGYITGIRFYKSAKNTGTHSGSLWSSSGTRLATATFSSETASGWQQVSFSTPVAINAGTVYVASYHVNGGHYSVDVNYFTGKGMDSPPLHALANGISGANGAYAYGASTVFPSLSWNNSNYWVDVVFSVTPSATLSSIALTPASATVAINGSQQFIATGTYSDGSTQNLTNQMTWSSSVTGVAVVSNSGLATGVGAGSSTISATLGSITRTTVLTVQPSALAITTATVGNAVLNAAYTASVAAGGGTQPYSWSVSAGTLPPGLTLGSTSGVISGTPTGAGSFSFTVQVKDSGTPQQTASVALNLTVVAQASYTIWPGSTVPSLVDGGADNPVELGVKFRSDTSGYITGIRFYKAASNTGTHSGSLWSSSGTRLATATFSSETASGWQQVNFSTPVAINAGTVYVASYHVNGGHYSVDANYFTGKGMDSPPLHALASGVSGSNGVYAYGTSSVFPSQSWNNSNYWIDVVFSSTPPATLVSLEVTPAGISIASGNTQQFIATGTYSDGSTKSVSSLVSWSSSNAGVATVNSSGLATANSGGSSTISATLGSISGSTTLTVVAALAVTTESLANGVTGNVYTAQLSVDGGIQPYSWTVTAGSLPPGLTLGNATGLISGTPTATGSFSFTVKVTDSANPQQAVSKTLAADIIAPPPIMLITSSSNPFSSYYAEILRSEGFNDFAVSDISAVTAAKLAAYDVAILGEMPLTSLQANLLGDWVSDGGNLIAMRPDKKLAGLLGLADKSATLSNGYLLVDTSELPGSGIVNQTIQFHGIADRYWLNGASSVAMLYTDADTSTSEPAVSLKSVGSYGGEAAAFTYDLARSVVYTRQGNPGWAGQERDGITPIRSNDLFYGNASFDPRPDWIDLDKVAIPQADEQQRLLANLIISMNSDKKPLPRFWYLPRNLKATIVMSGDDHGSNGTAGRFNIYKAMSPPGCSLENWECVRGTSYIYPGTPLSVESAASYVAEGFEIGAHITSNCTDWTPNSLEGFFVNDLAAWQSKYSSLPAPATNRLHCITWSDYSSMPTVELTHGIRLDTNYYYYPGSWLNNRPGMFTGSGMPMRFADASGNMIDVYQAVTQLTDESGQIYPYTIDTLLDRAIGAEGFYGVFTANMHNDVAETVESRAIVNSALTRGIPVVSARQMLTWLDGRNASSFHSLQMSGDTLGFSVIAGSGASGLVAMVPVPADHTVAGVTRDGTPVPFTVATLKGITYARFNATSGSYRIVYH